MMATPFPMWRASFQGEGKTSRTKTNRSLFGIGDTGILLFATGLLDS